MSFAGSADNDALMNEAVAALPVLVEQRASSTTAYLPLHVSARAEPLSRSSPPQYSPHSVSDLVANANARIKMERMELKAGDYEDGEEAVEVKDESGKRLSALELKRLRNRECMRLSRMRKMGELTAMKTEIGQLERHVRALQIQMADGADNHNGGGLGGTDASPNATAKRMIDGLQRENFKLRDLIREKDKLREILSPLLEQEEQRIILDEQQRVHEERHTVQFAWLRHVIPLFGLKAMSAADVTALVRQSCDQILASARHADTKVESPNHVLGWSDKRFVDDRFVHFMFSKNFAHQSVEEVTAKSWETSSNLDKINAFQPRQQHMVCLQRWGDDTIVLARNLNVPQLCSDGSELARNYCSVILVFRLQTPTGYVVGTRTLQADKVRDALLLAGEHRATYVDICYGLLFTPLSPDQPVGCNARFGGRAGSGTSVYTKVCAMDVLLATLRWENHCIAPLNRLTDSSVR